MPINDWQFWLVTVLAIGALWLLIRTVAPRRSTSAEDPACPNCASGAASSRSKRRVPLTIEKKRV